MMDCKQQCKIPKGLKIVGMVILGIIGAVVFAFIFGYFVQHLWNWLMPGIFNLKKIDFWQAFGLVLLARLLFGNNFGSHHDHDDDHDHKGHRHHRHRNSKKYENWCSEEWSIKGSAKDWSFYGEWWKNEGKEAFEAYIDRKKNETEETDKVI